MRKICVNDRKRNVIHILDSLAQILFLWEMNSLDCMLAILTQNGFHSRPSMEDTTINH